MTDPRRWTDEHADVTDLERELVQAGQKVTLPDEHKRELWASIAEKCPLPAVLESGGGGVSAAQAGGAASAVTTAALVKTFVVVGAVGAMAGAGYLAGRARPNPPLSVADPVAAAAMDSAAADGVSASEAAPETHATEAVVTPSARPEAKGADRPASIGAPDPSARASQLREESRITLLARRQLRSGDPKAALRLLEQAQVRFPDGVLSQEREALTIEALARSGAGDAAERRARDFLRENPRSPHAADVRAYRDR